MKTHKPKAIPRVTLGHIIKGGCVVLYDRNAKRWTTQAGRTLRAASIEGLIARAMLVANEDGLFPGMSQSYRLREG